MTYEEAVAYIEETPKFTKKQNAESKKKLYKVKARHKKRRRLIKRTPFFYAATCRLRWAYSHLSFFISRRRKQP